MRELRAEVLLAVCELHTDQPLVVEQLLKQMQLF
jgi:hypothetical protein